MTQITGHIAKLTLVPKRPKVPSFYRIVLDVPKLEAVKDLQDKIDSDWTIGFEPRSWADEEIELNKSGVPRDFNLPLPVGVE